LPTPSYPWPEGIDHPPEQLSEGIGNLYRHLQEGCPINKERGNLFAIPLKKLKVKINIQEATDSFKNCKSSSFNRVLSLYTTCSSSQSRETVPLKGLSSEN
jgi:hypothetical protein